MCLYCIQLYFICIHIFLTFLTYQYKFLINFNYNIIKAGKKPDSLLDCISFMKYILNNNQIDNYKEEFEKLNFILSSTDILNK